ncbi:hypothetical protein [Rhodopseudomonas telluris]|uniref:DUF2147 domain-containing protein n=1 Tax=Rhodopseudomonas telluris TaxID=644215 RepID=A0ABV6ENC9_9BRAD
MVRLAALLLVFNVIAAGGTPPAHAQAAFLLGDWQQIASNAGKCPTCRINLSSRGDDVMVAANNGWSAVVAEQPRPDRVILTGSGRWQVRSSRLDGKQFTADFEQRGDRLYMTMRIVTGGREWTVNAVYGRLWLGS